MQYTYNLDNSCETIFIESVFYKDSKNTMRHPHYHDFYELYFYMGNAMTYHIGDMAYAVEKYDLLFIDRGAMHKTCYQNGMKERTLVMFHPSFFTALHDTAPLHSLLQFLAQTPVLRFRADIKERLRVAFADTVSLYQSDAEDTFPLQIQLLQLLLSLRKYIENGFLLDVNEASVKKTHVVPDIITYINTHYNEVLTLDSLSSLFFIDKFYLCHAFKKATGQTVTAYLNKKRLTEAKRLLLSSDYPISEIFQLVGFQSQNHFNAKFKVMFGKTPSEIRTQRKN